MASINGNQHWNGIDRIFEVKSKDTFSTLDKMQKGLLKGYGDNSEVTYLLTHVNDDSTVEVEKDSNGHLTWKIGNKQIAIGSSWWERFKHNFKMIFVSSYKGEFEARMKPKIDLITNAYIRCINADHEKNEKIKDLISKIADKQAEISRIEMDIALVDQSISQVSQLLDSVEKLNKDIADFNQLGLGDRWWLSDEEKTTLNTKHKEFDERKESIIKQLKEIDSHQFKELNSNNLKVKIIEGLTLSFEEKRELVLAQLSSKNDEIKRLNNELRKEQGLPFDDLEMKEDAAKKAKELGFEGDDVSLYVEATAKGLIDDQVKVYIEASKTGLDPNEAAFYARLNAEDKDLYDYFRCPGKGATNCSTFADFFTFLIKDKKVQITVNDEGVSTLTLKAQEVVNLKLDGKDSKITLPTHITLDYSVIDQAWTLKGDGLRLQRDGMEISLDGTQFEVREHGLNLKADPSKQSFGINMALRTTHSAGLPIGYAAIKQDVFGV